MDHGGVVAARAQGDGGRLEGVAAIQQGGAACKAAGFRFAFHNHNDIVRKTGDVLPIDILMKETDPAPGAYDPEQDTWELYYLPDDFSQAHDVAAEHPEKLAELKALFWEEAEKHNVLPLLAAFSVFFGILPPMPTITTQTFYGDVENIASGMIPRVYGRSYAIEAELSVPAEGAEGVIVAEADEMGGFSLWVDENGLLHHSYSMMGVEHYQHVSTEPIPTGDVVVRMQFDADRQEPSAGGTVSLYANDAKIGEGRMEQDGRRALLRVCRHGHRPRQRPARRPLLRGEIALPLHRHGEEGRLRPQAGQPRR